MTNRQDQNPQDKPWNEAQFSQAQQGQGQRGRQQGLSGQQMQDHAGISQHGSSEVSGLSPQANASPDSASAGGQQRQFDSQGGGQQGGGGSHERFADQIRPHAEVVDESGNHVGTVDHLDGDRIKLSRRDSADGEHHYVSLSEVAGIEGGRVRLRERGDNDFGMEAGG